MYSIEFTSNALKQFKRLDKNLRERMISKLERIRIRPESYVDKLVGDPGYKLRVGDYRIIMDIEKNRILILVLRIGHRKKIYK